MSYRWSIFCQQEFKFKIAMLRSNLCDYSDADIVIRRRIAVVDTVNANERNKKLVFKKNTLFRSCISKSITQYTMFS